MMVVEGPAVVVAVVLVVMAVDFDKIDKMVAVVVVVAEQVVEFAVVVMELFVILYFAIELNFDMSLDMMK
jgi:hypothetical protein